METTTPPWVGNVPCLAASAAATGLAGRLVHPAPPPAEPALLPNSPYLLLFLLTRPAAVRATGRGGTSLALVSLFLLLSFCYGKICRGRTSAWHKTAQRASSAPSTLLGFKGKEVSKLLEPSWCCPVFLGLRVLGPGVGIPEPAGGWLCILLPDARCPTPGWEIWELSVLL